jgi:WD40 repeat protein
LALAGYQGIQLYREVGRKPQATRLFWQGSLLTCCWSPDGKIIAACSQDNSLHFWRVKSLQDAQMSGFPAKPRAMAFTPDSRYLVTGGSECLTTWDFSGTGPEGTAPGELHYHQDIVTTLTIAPDTGHLAAGSKDGVVSLWQNTAAEHPNYHVRMSAPLVGLHWQSLDGQQLLAALDQAGHVGVWVLYLG